MAHLQIHQGKSKWQIKESGCSLPYFWCQEVTPGLCLGRCEREDISPVRHERADEMAFALLSRYPVTGTVGDSLPGQRNLSLNLGATALCLLSSYYYVLNLGSWSKGIPLISSANRIMRESSSVVPWVCWSKYSFEECLLALSTGDRWGQASSWASLGPHNWYVGLRRCGPLSDATGTDAIAAMTAWMTAVTLLA